jgi:ABC-type branched-subunit amino acid transport system substrate-binding protein
MLGVMTNPDTLGTTGAPHTIPVEGPEPGPGPIRLGAVAPLSRPGFLEAGRHLRAGVELAVDEINGAGGISGRLIELLFRDTAGSPERGAAAVRDLAAEGAVAVVGEYHSVVAHAAAGAAIETGLPFVCSSAVLDAIVDARTDIVARIAPPQSYCWKIYADHLVESGRRSVLLVVQPDRYWSSGARVLRASLSERGVAVNEVEYMESLKDPIADVLGAVDGADAILPLVGYPEPAVSLVKAVREDARLTEVVIGDPAGRAEFPEWSTLLGEDGADIPFLRYRPSSPGPLERRVSERLTRTVGQAPSFVAFEGYDSVQVVAEALRTGGSDRQGVVKALSGVRVVGTRGTICLSHDSGSAVLQWTWPPVQIAAYRDSRRPDGISVLHQVAASESGY